MLYPSAFRSLVRQTRQALENETLLAGHSSCGGFGRGVGCAHTVECGGGIMERWNKEQGSVQPHVTHQYDYDSHSAALPLSFRVRHESGMSESLMKTLYPTHYYPAFSQDSVLIRHQIYHI
jgi:hypothetical protein